MSHPEQRYLVEIITHETFSPEHKPFSCASLNLLQSVPTFHTSATASAINVSGQWGRRVYFAYTAAIHGTPDLPRTWAVLDVVRLALERRLESGRAERGSLEPLDPAHQFQMHRIYFYTRADATQASDPQVSCLPECTRTLFGLWNV